MKKPSYYCSHRLGLILALIVLMTGSALVLKPARLAAAQGVGPSWNRTGSLKTARRYHTATLLANGKVLVVGGDNETGGVRNVHNSVELYDPATEMWRLIGSLNTPRSGHTATLLPDGRVLIVGGTTGFGSLNSAELYDPVTESWSVTASLNTSRVSHGATLLHNGKVLAAGGTTDGRNILNSAELYDPATKTWTVTGNINTTRFYHTTTLLTDGNVLVVGGGNYADNAVNILNSAEVYNPFTGIWNPTANLNTARVAHTATLLPDGEVLVAAGWTYDLKTDTTPTLNSAELYDPTAKAWSVTGNLNRARADYAQTATLLANGKVLLAGGGGLNSAELYDPTNRVWSVTGNLNEGREGFTAILLANGKVLAVGGYNFTGNTAHILNSAELFDPNLPQTGTDIHVSAASYRLMGLASEAIAAAFGAGLATTTSAAEALPLPTQLVGTSVKVKDIAGIERLAPLFFVSPTQVNYQIPPGTASGAATVTITSGDGTTSTGVALVRAVAPSLFAANGDGHGVAAGLVLRVGADGSQRYEPIAQFDAAQNKFIARPLALSPETDQVYLLLFGTGLRQRHALSSVIASLGGTYAEVRYAGAQGDFAGLDQVNVLVPRSLSGRGEIDVLLTVEAQMTNLVRVNIK